MSVCTSVNSTVTLSQTRCRAWIPAKTKRVRLSRKHVCEPVVQRDWFIQSCCRWASQSDAAHLDDLLQVSRRDKHSHKHWWSLTTGTVIRLLLSKLAASHPKPSLRLMGSVVLCRQFQVWCTWWHHTVQEHSTVCNTNYRCGDAVQVHYGTCRIQSGCCLFPRHRLHGCWIQTFI